MDSQPMLPIHSHTHKHNGVIKYSQASFQSRRGGQSGRLYETERGAAGCTVGLKDALKMFCQSESWMERFCFGITWRGETQWRDNTVKKKIKTKVLLTGCVLCGAGMTLDATWLHMAWLSVSLCRCVWVCLCVCVFVWVVPVHSSRD